MNPAHGDEQNGPSRRRSAFGIMASGGAATFVVSIQALVLMPLYLRFVGPRLYGAWVASGDLFFYLNTLEFGIPNLMIQKIGASSARRDLAAVGRWAASGLAILAGGAAVLMMLCFPLAQRLPGWFNVDERAAVTLSRCFLLGGAAAALTLVNQAFVALARGLQETAYQNVSTVVSSLLGFGAAIGSVLYGAGLYSIPVSLVTRATCSAAFSVAFWYRRIPPAVRDNFVPDWCTFKSLLQLSPLTALGTIGYTTGSQTENLLTGMILGTDAVVLLSITRRGADVLRNLVDMMTHASFGAFSHLAASPQRQKAPGVFDELTRLRISVAVTAAAGFMALNKVFVGMWVGNSYYAGSVVTALIALNFVFSGQSYLVNSLYRATGAITGGALLLVGEAVCRLPLSSAGAKYFGLAGLQAAAVLTAIVSLTAGNALCRRLWREPSVETSPTRTQQFAPHAAVFVVGMACCLVAGLTNCGLGVSGLLGVLLAMALIYLVRTDAFFRGLLLSFSPKSLARFR